MGTTSIRKEDLWVALIELGGKEALDDFALNISLESELQSRGLEIYPKDIQEEENLFFALDSNLNTDMLTNMLQKKGIGNIRKKQLLWRNAALRKLIKDQVIITDDAVLRMFSIVHGAAYPSRIIVISTLDEANKIVKQLKSGIPFSDVAIEESIDSSAIAGGRVNPISIADPIWPSPIREVISTIDIHSISDPIFIGDRWVILQVTDIPIVSNTTFNDAEFEMRQLATLAQERFLMESLAQSLSEKNTIKIIDADLKRLLGSNSHTAK